MIYKIDHYIAELMHELYVWGGDITNNIMKLISFIAEAGILFLLIGVGLVLFKRTRKIGAAILLAVACGFLLTNIVLKNAIARARPFDNISSDFYKWWLDAGATYESGYSIPSGHTTATTAFALAIFLTTNKKYSWPILLFPLAMASSRIYLMVHYFSDCVGGLIVGSVAAALAFLIVHLVYKSKIRLFVWAREFDVFHPKGVKALAGNKPKKSKKSTAETTVESVEEFVYKTQIEETKENSNIDKEVEPTQPNSNQNKKTK